jgi:hypothetical protein
MCLAALCYVATFDTVALLVSRRPVLREASRGRQR